MLTSDGEHAMMQTLHKKNIECPLPVLNIHGTEKSMEKLSGGISMFNISFLLGSRPRLAGSFVSGYSGVRFEIEFSGRHRGFDGVLFKL